MKKQIKVIFFAIVILIVVALVVGIVYFAFLRKDLRQSDSYKAIFLANGQVYFGKMVKEKRGYIELSNVYYIQMQAKASDAGKEATQQATEPVLVKLGSELHGPADQMLINRDQVLFIEVLKSDSKVLQAIEKEQSK